MHAGLCGGAEGGREGPGMQQTHLNAVQLLSVQLTIDLNGSVHTYHVLFWFFYFIVCGNSKPNSLSQVIPVVSLEQYKLLPVNSRVSVE